MNKSVVVGRTHISVNGKDEKECDQKLSRHLGISVEKSKNSSSEKVEVPQKKSESPQKKSESPQKKSEE